MCIASELVGCAVYILKRKWIELGLHSLARALQKEVKFKLRHYRPAGCV